jgi:hypothetical protein
VAEKFQNNDRKKNGRNPTTIHEIDGRGRSETPFSSRKRRWRKGASLCSEVLGLRPLILLIGVIRNKGVRMVRNIDSK